MRRLLLCLVLGLVGSPAYAQEVTPTPTPPTKGPNAEGDYGGVQPGQTKKPDQGKKPKKPPPKGTLSWIGFETKSGGAEVFLQSVAPFEVSQRVDGSVLVVSLTGVTRLGQNTWRPIDTRFFETTLSRITAKKKGKGIEIRVAFKNAKDAGQGSMRTATEADGMYYAYLAFSGTGPAPTTTSTGAPAGKDVEK